MLTVRHQITIGSSRYTPAAHTRLVDLQTQATLEAPVNTCRLVLAPPEGLRLKVEDSVAVEIGYEDELELIFTGIVGAVDWGIESVRIEASYSSTVILPSRIKISPSRSLGRLLAAKTTRPSLR